MTQSLLQQLETSIRENRALVEFGAALNRLRENRDFKTVILDGYFKNEAVRLVHLKADPNMQSPEKQLAIAMQLDAIANVSQYLRTVDQLTDMAKASLESAEGLQAEIAAEESQA